MQTFTSIEGSHRERVIKGRAGWWYLGAGGVARLTAEHVNADGTLTALARDFLEQSGLTHARDYRTFALTVLTSTACNLGCGYCFQNTAQDSGAGYHPPRIKSARLTSETITDVLAFADRHMAAAGLDRLSILLFGGEPLLNPRGAVELLTRAADRGLRSASMISNGTLLTVPLARKLAAAGLNEVQVTFDGDRGTHDHIRIRRSGGGTFDTIVEAIRRASEATAIRWNLRVNVSHHNHQGIERLIEQLAAAVNPNRCSLYFARVGDVGVGYDNSLGHDRQISEDFIGWYRAAIRAGFAVPRPGAHKPCQACSFKNGRFGAVVSADGTLASCWETAGRPEWEVGSVTEGYLPEDQTIDRWTSCEDLYQYSDDNAALAGFRDAVDAAVLDELTAVARL